MEGVHVARLIDWITTDSGAVTVDWVVLTAAAAAFGIIVMTQLSIGATDVAGAISTSLQEVEVTDLDLPAY